MPKHTPKTSSEAKAEREARARRASRAVSQNSQFKAIDDVTQVLERMGFGGTKKKKKK